MKEMQQNFITVSFDETALANNFDIIRRNFEQLFAEHKKQLDTNKALLDHVNLRARQSRRQLQDSISAVDARLAQQDQKNASFESRLGELLVMMADKESKIVDLYNFKRNQNKLSQKLKQKIEEVQQSQNASFKEIGKLADVANRKVEKSEFEKVRKEVPNLQLRIQTLMSKQNDINARLDSVKSPFTDEAEVKKRLGDDAYDVILAQVTAGLSRVLELRGGKVHVLGDEGKKKIEKQVGREQFIEFNSKFQELDIKIARMIEHEKAKDKLLHQLVTKRENRNSHAEDEMKLQEAVKQIVLLQSRLSQFEEKAKGQERKSEALRLFVEEAEERIRVQSALRFDEVVKQLQAETINQVKGLQAKLDLKADLDFCLYLKEENNRAIRGLLNSLSLKPDKADIKKALLFLEAKVKELSSVLIEQTSKDPAYLTKSKALTCLSCDKAVEDRPTPVEEQTAFHNTSGSKFLPLSCERPNLTQSSFFKRRLNAHKSSESRTLAK